MYLFVLRKGFLMGKECVLGPGEEGVGLGHGKLIGAKREYGGGGGGSTIYGVKSYEFITCHSG